MAIRDIFKVTRKTFFNPRAWIDWNWLKAQNAAVTSYIRAIFTPAAPDREETFAEAKKRLKLNEKDIETTTKNYRLYALIFLGIAVVILMYSFYLLFRYSAIFDFGIGLAVTAFAAVQAFRFDFWALQLRERRLGLTFEDWKQSILGSKEKVK